MKSSMMSGLTIGGAVLVLIGLLAFAVPVFTTHKTTDLAKIGDLKLQSTESSTFVIPPLAGGAALTLGFVLLAAGFYQKR